MKNRNINLDLIRTFAVFSVIAVHFFLNSGFYDVEIYGRKMIIMSTIRNFFMICVPLFLLLTGYLMGDKKPTKKYFLNISKVLYVYVFASIFCIAYNSVFLGYNFSIKNTIGTILNFTGAKYSWYINMYIGLYFLIPYLNLIYQNMKQKKEKQKFIMILVFTILMPSMCNLKYQLLPNWWTGIYPIVYYFIGLYIKEYGLAIKKWICFIYIFALTLLLESISFIYSYETLFHWGIYNYYNSILVMIIAVLVFQFILKIDLNSTPKSLKKIIMKISDASLGMYLLSYIFDNIYYNILNSNILNVTDRFIYMPLLVIIVFLSSFILSVLINLIIKIFKHLLEKSRSMIL